MRWLGLDLGERRIGLALSDPLEITAQSHSVYQRQNSLKQDLAFLEEFIIKQEVEGLVIGLPKNMNGTEGPMAEKARLFGEMLTKKVNLPIVFWDERLSTSSASRVLLEADLSRSARKKKVDQLAAAIILQNYLDYHK